MNWNLQNLRGSKDAVKLKLAGEKIPEAIKVAIAGELDALPEDAVGCRVDAYCQDSTNHLKTTITRNLQITIVGLRL